MVYVFDPTIKIIVPRPGAELHGSQINVKINSLGFRGDEFSKVKPPNTVRIACLGASTTYCPEVSSNAAAWPSQLQRLLQTRYSDVRIEVINAGIQGLKASHSLKNLRYRVLPLQPDLVIFYEVHNDLVVDTRALAIRRGLLDDNVGKLKGVNAFLAQKSLLFNLISRNLEIVWDNREVRTGKLSDIRRDLPDRFVGEIQQMHDLLSARHIPLVLSRFLVRFRGDQPRKTQYENAEIAFVYMPWMTVDSLLDSFNLYNNAVARFARSRGIPFVEDSDHVPGDGVHYVDHVHLSDAGCKAMAERFARFVDEQKILDSIVAGVASNSRVPDGALVK
jgi:lysophospholipase L1-like esterase